MTGQREIPGSAQPPSGATADCQPIDLKYAGMPQTRRINHKGCLQWRKELIFVSSAIASWSVGPCPRSDNLFDVNFANLLLGQLEPATRSFIRALAARMKLTSPTQTRNPNHDMCYLCPEPEVLPMS